MVIGSSRHAHCLGWILWILGVNLNQLECAAILFEFPFVLSTFYSFPPSLHGQELQQIHSEQRVVIHVVHGVKRQCGVRKMMKVM